MAQQKALKTKRPAVAHTKTAPAAPTVVPMARTERVRRIEEAEARGKALVSLVPELKGLDDDRSKLCALVGLIDLLKSRDCNEGSIGASWLGRSIVDQLFEVAAKGVLEVEINPGRVMDELRDTLERFQSDLKDARELAERYEDFDAIGVCV
jgi:hypothetical protein